MGVSRARFPVGRKLPPTGSLGPLVLQLSTSSSTKVRGKRLKSLARLAALRHV